MTDNAKELLALADKLDAWSPIKGPIAMIARERRMCADALRLSARQQASAESSAGRAVIDDDAASALAQAGWNPDVSHHDSEALSTAPGEPCAHRTMTREEYNALQLVGWHSVRHTDDGLTEVSYTTPQPAAGWDEAQIEAAARAVCAIRMVGPDTRHQNYSDDPIDYTDENGQTFHLGWRNQVPTVKAVIASLRREAPAPAEGVRVEPIDENTPYPSTEAMKVAVELEIHAALGQVQTVVIGKLIQQAIDAALAARPDTAEARLREAIYDKLNVIADEMDDLYHHAKREFDLPNDGAVFGKSEDGLNWHCPYRPAEIAEYLRSKIEDICNTALSPPSGGDEAKKSEGGEPDVERTQRRLAVSDDGLGPMQAIPREPPSGPSEPSPPADRREIVAQALSFLRDVAQNKETWTPEAERVYQNAQKTVAALDGGRDA